MNNNYYCFLSYKVKTERENKYRYYRGILAEKADRVLNFKVAKIKDLALDESLCLATLRSYKAELFPSKIEARNKLNKVFKMAKDWNDGVRMTPEDIMRVSVRTQRPEELTERDKIIYERAEIGFGKINA